MVRALNSVEVDGRKLSAEPMDEDNADSQMEDLERVIDQATIEPAQCKDLVKEALDTSSGHAEDIVVATPSQGQSSTMTQASAVVGNTFVVVSGQGSSSGTASPTAETPDVEAILQESVTKISEQ